MNNLTRWKKAIFPQLKKAVCEIPFLPFLEAKQSLVRLNEEFDSTILRLDDVRRQNAHVPALVSAIEAKVQSIMDHYTKSSENLNSLIERMNQQRRLATEQFLTNCHESSIEDIFLTNCEAHIHQFDPSKIEQFQFVLNQLCESDEDCCTLRACDIKPLFKPTDVDILNFLVSFDQPKHCCILSEGGQYYAIDMKSCIFLTILNAIDSTCDLPVHNCHIVSDLTIQSLQDTINQITNEEVVEDSTTEEPQAEEISELPIEELLQIACTIEGDPIFKNTILTAFDNKIQDLIEVRKLLAA